MNKINALTELIFWYMKQITDKLVKYKYIDINECKVHYKAEKQAKNLDWVAREASLRKWYLCENLKEVKE